MITERTYKNLVILGANIVKDIKALDAMENSHIIFEKAYHIDEYIGSLASIFADIGTVRDYSYYLAHGEYADMISVYAHDENLGEKYFELFWKMQTGEEGTGEAFEAFVKTIPANILYWVRRNLYSC